MKRGAVRNEFGWSRKDYGLGIMACLWGAAYGGFLWASGNASLLGSAGILIAIAFITGGILAFRLITFNR